MPLNVLIVEDEKDIRDIVGLYLLQAGFHVSYAKDGFEGLEKLGESMPDIVVLDVMMPGISGFDVLRDLRRISDIPVIMLTAKQEEVDRLHGFDLGADDYVPKPFSPKELVMRVQAIVKRVYGDQSQKNALQMGPFRLDVSQMALYKNDTAIEITAKEFQLLEVFFKNVGQLLTREQLIQDAFGHEYDGFDRNIDSYIKKIRQKIEDNSRDPKYLKTKYGAGYIFGGGTHDN